MHLKTTTAFVFGSALLLGLAAPSQKAALKAPGSERFLFVVDTSSSMKRLDAANRQTIFDLVYDGLKGRMRSNDTYGIWTFDENIYAGEFPMQIWNATNNLHLASQAATFLKGRRYKGESRFQPVVDKLMPVVRSIKDVNILIISDGHTPFAGTSVDRAINASYTARAGERRQAKKPFITTLVAREGSIVMGSVTIAGEPIRLPDRPMSTVKAGISTLRPASSNSAQIKTAGGLSSASEASTRPAAQSKSARPAIIMRGKSPSPGREDNPSTAPIPATASSANSDATPSVPAHLTAAATPTQVEPSVPPAIIQNNPTIVAPADASKPASSDSSSNLSANISQPDTTLIAQTGSSGELRITPKANGDQAPQLSNSEFKASAVQKPENPERSSPHASDKGSAGSSTLFTPLVPSPSPPPSLLPHVLTVAAREPNPSTNVVPQKSSAVTAVAVTTGAFLRPLTMVLIGAGLFVTALGVTVWAFKRYRSAPQTSFISRSMDGQ